MGKRRYHVSPTKKTPLVSLDKGHLKIDGRSIPEDSNSFYEPIYNWVKGYSGEKLTPTRIDLNFEYINTSSTKWIYVVLRELGMNTGMEDKVEINWFYEEGDDDMAELGYILRSMVPCRFNIIETEE